MCGRREGLDGVGGGEGEGKPPQVKTRGHKFPTDGPDGTTKPRLITPYWCTSLMPMCRSWFYSVVNPPSRKADHLSLATGDMLCG